MYRKLRIKIAELVLPKEVIDRAYEIFNSMNVVNDDIVKEIAKIDVNNLTPVQALVELDRIVRLCKKRG